MTQQSDDLRRVLDVLGLQVPEINSITDHSWGNPGKPIQLRFTTEGGAHTTVSGACLQSAHLVMYPNHDRASIAPTRPTESHLVIAGGTVEDELGCRSMDEDGLADDHPNKGQMRIPLRSVLYIALGNAEGNEPF